VCLRLSSGTIGSDFGKPSIYGLHVCNATSSIKIEEPCLSDLWLYSSPMLGFSLGKYGPLVSHSFFWLGLLTAFLVSGRVCAALYGGTLSGWIAMRRTSLRSYAKTVSTRRYLKTLTTQSDEEEGRVIKAQLERHTPQPGREDKGFSRFWAALLSLMLAGTLTVIYFDHVKIHALEQELSSPPNMEEWHGLRVTGRSPSSFTALTLNPRTREWLNAFYNLCNKPDGTPFILDTEIQIGATIKSIDWQIDRAHGCKNMNSRYAGFSLERTPDGQPILANWQP
jgi:hypothetical protein